jgi:glycosyltransferase involved in cell wall biosynthesis
LASVTNHQRLALIAYHFPPENAAGAARPFRFYRYLPEFGFDPRVFTAADPGPDRPENVVHVPDELGEYWLRGGPKPKAGPMGLAELAFRRYAVIAGVGFQWSRRVAGACEEWRAKRSGDRPAIFSTYPPAGAVLMPLWLKPGSFRIVLDYRDPFSSISDDDRQPDYRGRRWIDSRAIARSDLVIANSDAAAEGFRARFPAHAHKVHAIWNGFDPAEDVAALPIPNRIGPVIAHVGAIYTGRSPDAVLASVGRLRSLDRQRYGGIRIALVGPLGYGARVDPELVESGQREQWLDYVPEMIPKADARRIAAEADYLLLIQPQSSVQVPAKLFEYLRIGRPILAYAPKDSAIEWLLARAGVPYQCIYPGEAVGEVDAKVRKLVETPTGPYAASDWFLEAFDGRNQTRRLTELIQQIR